MLICIHILYKLLTLHRHSDIAKIEIEIHEVGDKGIMAGNIVNRGFFHRKFPSD